MIHTHTHTHTPHAQLLKREEIISKLQAEEQALQQRYVSACERAEAVDSARQALEKEYEQVFGELESSEKVVRDLEGRLEGQVREREEEVERCSQLINQLKEQLSNSEEQRQKSEEKVSCSRSRWGVVGVSGAGPVCSKGQRLDLHFLQRWVGVFGGGA